MKAYSVTLHHAFKDSILTHHVVAHHHMELHLCVGASKAHLCACLAPI